jgi:hypothetical protein
MSKQTVFHDTYFFTRVYGVLVQTCGAKDTERMSDAFVSAFTDGFEQPWEYRLSCKIGGGKFRFPQFTVDGYPELETPESLAMCKRTNEALQPLRDEYAAARNDMVERV